MKHSILVVDDDASIRSVLRMALEDAGMSVTEASNGRIGVQEQRRHPADLVVLDIGMPELDGFETCMALREFSTVPVLFLTARDDEIDRLLGFQLGGDDYVSKPFSPRELILRIKAILARAKTSPEPRPLDHGALTLNPLRHEAALNGHPLDLTALEFSLLQFLVEKSDRVLSRNLLIEGVYGYNPSISDRTVDSHVRNLRRKAKELGYNDLIRTVHGVGLHIGDCTS